MTKKYRVLMSEIHSVWYTVEAKNEEEAKELINETLYGRGIYGKKIDTIKHAHPTVDYAVQVTSEGEPIL